ncbi:fatty acid desaturase [Synechococcus sp. CS-1325]|nr:fatty acid desaturase [Synechococcus sp. CS-1325]MCT0199792.1 fatty acid desaturase [Synechococcus sp. CS-1325]PZU96103.1 MAG: acyl-CoA desaturase [Cyanobium sp.]
MTSASVSPSIPAAVPVIPADLPTSLATVAFMVAIHALALVALLPGFWSTMAVLVLVVLYWLTACVGVTLGYHRLLAHRAFRVPAWLEAVIITCGTLSCQHGPIDWAGLHRHHHLHSDDPADHHNSHLGFWWSHFGWMLKDVPAKRQVVVLTPDLQRNRYYRWLNRNFLLLQVPLAVLLWWLGEATGAGGLALVLWGIPLRLVLVYHATWMVNSATHRWGYVSYPSGDQSRNNWWVALLTFGEGWHNNHHAFPSSARMGFRWWEIDVTWWHIRLLHRLGLADRIRLASPLRRCSP